jgi:general secretion pathway protein D
VIDAVRHMAAGLRFGFAVTVVVLMAGTAPAQLPGAGDGAPGQDRGEVPRLRFQDAPLEFVLAEYGDVTGRTLLQAPGLPKVSITLENQTVLTLDEYLKAIETVLAMHGIALIKDGERFVKVVPIAEARKEEMPIETREAPLPETGELVSQMIPLRHIDIQEAKTAIDPLKHSYAQVQLFERINSVLVTDTAANVNRIAQVLEYIDQPVEVRETPSVVQIRFAKASEIKSKLEEIIKDAQDAYAKKVVVSQDRRAGQPGVVKREVPTIPGVIRASRPEPQPAPEAPSLETLIEEAERGIIRGRVHIVADDRTNILIIITRPENMVFFEKIVQTLDVETSPDVTVRVIRLEFAEAATVASMLNELIGAAGGNDDVTTAAKDSGGESAELSEYVRERREQAGGERRKSKVGELSAENIKILSDERTNALILMASKSDMATIEEIIADMDMMLSQVLVEAVILEVNLGDNFSTGIDWLQRSMIAYQEKADGSRSARAAFAGTGGGGTLSPANALSFTDAGSIAASAGLTYYVTLFDLNLDMVLQAVASDSRTRILSSPVVLTTDNKAATIDVSTSRYFFKGKKYAGDADGNPIYEDDVERQKVGIVLNVTPRINEKKHVVMEIEQTIENVSGEQQINEAKWPIVTTRKINATVAVRSGDTIVLGGLVQNSETKTRSKIPLLGDIPLLGIPFRYDSRDEARDEVIVLLTPYVLDNPQEIATDARRRLRNTGVHGMWQPGWSASRLAGSEVDSEPEAPAPAVLQREPADKPAGRRAGGQTARGAEADRFLDALDRRMDSGLSDLDAWVGNGGGKKKE